MCFLGYSMLKFFDYKSICRPEMFTRRRLGRLLDYALDTLIVNLVYMIIIIPWYYFTGMPIDSIKLVVFAFLTIGWVSSFPIPIVLRWFRKRVKYLEIWRNARLNCEITAGTQTNPEQHEITWHHKLENRREWSNRRQNRGRGKNYLALDSTLWTKK